MMQETDRQDVVPADWQDRFKDHFDGIAAEHRPKSNNLSAAFVIRHPRNIHQHWTVADQQLGGYHEHRLELDALVDDIRLHLADFLVAQGRARNIRTRG